MDRNEFIKKFKVGNKICCDSWNAYETIEYIGNEWFVSRNEYGLELTHDYGIDWRLYNEFM